MLRQLVFIAVVSFGPELIAALSDDAEYLRGLQIRESRYNFKLWQLKHEKQYIDVDEEKIRYDIYMHNIDHIQTLNKQHHGETVFEANQFADMTPEEFKRTVLMPSRPVPKHPQHKYLKSSDRGEPLPETFDWRDHGRVTSVKDQGSAGTCWAFSTVANVEGQFERFYNKLVNLSVEQVVDCDDSKDPAKDYADCGVYGGWPYLAFGYLERQGGIEKELDYPYCAGGGKNLCFVCPNGAWNTTLCGPPMPYCNMTQSCPYRLKPKLFVTDLKIVDWKITSQGGMETWEDYGYCSGGGDSTCFVCPMGIWNSTLCGPPMPYCNMTQSCPYKLDRSKFVPSLNITGWNAIPTNETDIAQQLMNIGPLSVAMDARMLQFYRSGVFNPFICSKTSLDHAVLLVGFGTETSVFGSTPYWLVKNSWGPKWGDHGYFKIKRGAGTCGINTQVTTALLKH